MAIRVERVSDTVIRVTGYPPLQRDRVRARLRQAARDMQDRIADDFESEEAAGRSLRTNTDRYDDSKIMAGYDPRLGHRTGRLQLALWKPGLVKLQERANDFQLILLRGVLQSRVPYSDYYADTKVRGGNLLHVYPALVSIARAAMSGIRAPRGEAGPRVAAIKPVRGFFGAFGDVLGTVFGRVA